MKIKAYAIAAAMVFVGAPPAVAQVQYDTTQLDQRADVERNRILLNSTVNRKHGYSSRNRSSAQAQACADRGRFRREYGANNPKLQRLESLCAQAGY